MCQKFMWLFCSLGKEGRGDFCPWDFWGEIFRNESSLPLKLKGISSWPLSWAAKPWIRESALFCVKRLCDFFNVSVPPTRLARWAVILVLSPVKWTSPQKDWRVVLALCCRIFCIAFCELLRLFLRALLCDPSAPSINIAQCRPSAECQGLVVRNGRVAKVPLPCIRPCCKNVASRSSAKTQCSLLWFATWSRDWSLCFSAKRCNWENCFF